MAGKLILARHQESEWNKVGKWTGLQDRHLTEDGFINSEHMGILIKDLHIDQAYTSMLVRSIETLSCMMNVCERVDVPIEHAAALNERDYGDYTGKNKYEMQALLGDDEFKRLRRSWDYPIPHGESLKMVYERTVPFFTGTIVPKVMAGQNVLIVAHGNSLRSLVKYIENISDEDIADVEFPFGMIIVYDIDDHGKMLRKEVRESNPVGTPRGRTKIVATIGPASGNRDALTKMIQNHMDIARLNFSWGSLEEHASFISLIRSVAQEQQTTIPVMIDLPGPRIQETQGHTYDKTTICPITDKDKTFIEFAAQQQVEYIAVSFVGAASDITLAKELIRSHNGTQKVVAKIERTVALESLDAIIAEADAVMVARGDLGNEVPIEQIPFVEATIIKKCRMARKPVIVATQMLLSMVEHPEPTRAEVTDVAYAVLNGADMVMLSEESARGKYPVEAVTVMNKVIVESEKHPHLF